MKTKSLLLSLAVVASAPAFAADWDYQTINPNPEETLNYVTDLETVSINFGSEWSFEVVANANATLTNTETNETINATSTELWALGLSAMNNYVLRMQFPTLTKNGTYKLTVPAGTMNHAGSANPEMSFTYIVKDPTLEESNLPELELLSVIPAAGTALPSMGDDGDGRQYSFTTNLDEHIGYITVNWYDVTNADEPEWLASTDATHEGSGAVEFVKNTSVPKMYVGHDYHMQVVCYDKYQMPRTEIGKFNVAYTGTTPEYVYSNIKAINVTPNPDDFIINSESDDHFTVTFDAAVTINETLSSVSLGSGESIGYTSIVSNAEKTEWTFTIPAMMLDSKSITCFVLATDAEGRTVRGNDMMARFESGSENLSGFMFQYISNLGGVELIVAPTTDDHVTSLKTFTITAEGCDDIIPSWTSSPSLISGRDVIYTFDMDKDCDTTTPGKAILTLPEEVTAKGAYTLLIPSDTFYCFNGDIELGGNKQLMENYNIGEDEPVETVYDFNDYTIDPEAGKVTELSNFTLRFAEIPALMYYDAYILDEEGTELQKADLAYDDDDWNLILIKFATPVTEAGNYVLYIPEGSIGDEAYTMDEGGHANAEIRISYYIEPSSVEGIETDSVSGDVYNVAGVLVLRNATADDVKTLDKGIYILNGKKIVVK